MTAKTRADFFAEGQRAGRMNNTQNAMPEFGKGSSWQAKAFAEGWHEVRDTIALKKVLADDAQGAADDKLLADLGVDMKAVEATLATENVAPVESPVVKHHTVTVQPVLPLRAVPPKVVLSHINRLSMEIATTGNETRRQRLIRSVNRCIAKWNRRLHA